MILIDASLLIYAYVNTYRDHAKARDWLDNQLNGPGRVALPWASLLAFLRVVTNPRVHAIPAPTAEACDQIESWLFLSNVWTPDAGEHHGPLIIGLLRATQARGNLVHDAHLAALAIEHGLTLCSTDRDFARFPGLRWIDPLAA